MVMEGQGQNDSEALADAIIRFVKQRRFVAKYYNINAFLSITHIVMCLTRDASLAADQGVASLIPARSHTFLEVDHEIIFNVILLPSPESFKKGCCQLQGKVCARSTG